MNLSVKDKRTCGNCAFYFDRANDPAGEVFNFSSMCMLPRARAEGETDPPVWLDYGPRCARTVRWDNVCSAFTQGETK